jgi:hypothetical protein
MAKIRFDLCIFNYNKINSFVDNAWKLRNFDPDLDRVIIIDCSDRESKEEILTKVSSCLPVEHRRNLFFAKQPNYGNNTGGILRYIRMLLAEPVNTPTFAFFMQDHYLEPEYWENDLQKSDTIGEKQVIDLKHIADLFETDYSIGCIFNTSGQIFYFEGYILAVAGSNFVCRPEIYVNYFRQHGFPSVNMHSYIFSADWERLFGKIMVESGYYFYDLKNSAKFRYFEYLPESIKPGEGLGFTGAKYQSIKFLLKNVLAGRNLKPLKLD